MVILFEVELEAKALVALLNTIGKSLDVDTPLTNTLSTVPNPNSPVPVEVLLGTETNPKALTPPVGDCAVRLSGNVNV